MATKILRKGNPLKMLKRIATERDNIWTVKKPKTYRTEMGKRSFSARVSRLWMVLPEELKTLDTSSKQTKVQLLEFIRTTDMRWILWGEVTQNTVSGHEGGKDTNRHDDSHRNNEGDGDVSDKNTSDRRSGTDDSINCDRNSKQSCRREKEEERSEWTKEEMLTIELIFSMEVEIENDEYIIDEEGNREVTITDNVKEQIEKETKNDKIGERSELTEELSKDKIGSVENREGTIAPSFRDIEIRMFHRAGKQRELKRTLKDVKILTRVALKFLGGIGFRWHSTKVKSQWNYVIK